MSLFGRGDFRAVSPVGGMMDTRTGDTLRPTDGRVTTPTVVHRKAKRPLSPQLKKCRICFQTDILDDRPVVAQGKGGPRSLRMSFLSWWWRRDSFGISSQPDDDGFISPCACKGSMAWVHRQCLEEWRYKSARRDSFYNCEYCFVAYRFRHTWMASLLNNPFTLILLTTLVTMTMVMAMVFVVGAAIPMKFTIELADDIGGAGGGFFGMDGIFVPISPTNHRWITKTEPPTARSKSIKIPTTRAPREAEFKVPPTKTISGSARKTNATIQSAKPPPTVSASSEHSTISYFNVAYWLTGHSIDEREEEMNDFLLAMMDVSTLKIWTASIAILGLFALLRDGTQWSLLVGSFLVISLFGMQFGSGTAGGGLGLACLFFPVPALFGAYRFLCWQYEMVELAVDTFIKNFSAELENFQETSS